MKKLILLFLSIINYSIIYCQNVGISTTSPKARLHVADSNVLFTGLPALPANAFTALFRGIRNNCSRCTGAYPPNRNLQLNCSQA